MSFKQLQRYADEIKRFVADGDYVETPEGVLVHNDILWRGRFYDADTGRTLGTNRITEVGMNYLLDAGLRGSGVTTTWYQALLSSGTPADSWTATQVANSFENKSQTEGYSGANRPAFTPNAAAGGVMDSVGSEAVYNIVTATNVTFTGAAIISSQARGAAAGVLLAAASFQTPETHSNGTVWKFGYEIKLLN